MILSELVWSHILEFAEQYSLDSCLKKTTNVCSVIILSNELTRISIYIEEMDFYLYAEVEIFNSKGETLNKVRIDDRTSNRIVSLRKKGLRSWSKKVQDRILNEMVGLYISYIQKSIDEQFGLSTQQSEL